MLLDKESSACRADKVDTAEPAMDGTATSVLGWVSYEQHGTLVLFRKAGEHALQPGVEPFCCPLPHHLHKGLRVGGQCREEWISLLDLMSGHIF